MYVDIVPNRNSPPAVLLRESLPRGRESGRAAPSPILSQCRPTEIVEGLRVLLRGGTAVERFEDSFWRSSALSPTGASRLCSVRSASSSSIRSSCTSQKHYVRVVPGSSPRNLPKNAIGW